jgi:methanesulfonate monooxygenase small subunit
MYLDREAFTDYLALLDSGCRYAITAYSPDIRKDMTYLSLDKGELGDLLSNIANHVHLPGKLFRQAALYSVEEKGGYWDAMSYVTVIHTNPDGASSVFCVARYSDQIVIGSQGALLTSRTVSMETRDIGAGCHYPI